jgi:hypothetical protein
MIRDRYMTEDIDVLLARISEQIKCQLQYVVSQVAVVVHAASEATLALGRESATGTHLTAAIATVDAPLPEERIRWVAESVATSNQLYVRPRRVNPFGPRAHSCA